MSGGIGNRREISGRVRWHLFRPLNRRGGDRRITVREILDRWHGEDHAYFKLTGEDGALYILRQDRERDTWELILMEISTSYPPRVAR